MKKKKSVLSFPPFVSYPSSRTITPSRSVSLSTVLYAEKPCLRRIFCFCLITRHKLLRLMCRGISLQKPADSRQEADRVSYYRSFVIISSNVLTRYPCHSCAESSKLMSSRILKHHPWLFHSLLLFSLTLFPFIMDIQDNHHFLYFNS